MTRMFWAASLIVASSAVCLAADEKQARASASANNIADSAATVLVEVDGVKITLGDYERKHPTGLFQARNNFYEAEHKAVDAYIDEYLVNRQAQRENVSVNELLNRHINNAVPPPPSDEALRVYYEGVDTGEPFETAKDKIVDYLRQRRVAKLKTEYMASLRKAAVIEFRIGSPRALMSMKDTHVRGGANAPVLLVEFADYECPYCQVMQAHLEKLQKEFGDKLAFVYKDMPLPTHANAQKAAEAAHCAGVQGKFWEYHDMLFANKQLEVGQLKGSARTLGLNGSAFDQCLDSGAQASAVKAQQAEGQALGLPGTPAFFVNGRVINGASDYETLKKTIEEELHAASSSRTQIAER